MSPLLIALGIAILVYVLFVIAVPKAVPSESDEYLRDALERLAEETKLHEQERQEVLRGQLSENSQIVRTILGTAPMRPIYEAALQAGLHHNLQLVLIIMAIGFGGGTIAGIMLHQGGLAVAIGLILAYLLPLKYCNRRVIKRNEKFIDLFPDALDTIARSVRSGFPLSVALQILAENAEEPVCSEFRQVTDEIALGRNLSQALSRLASRINEPDIRFFVVVLTVQQETGGNLSETVSNLSNIIRKRKQLRDRIKALTSEGKATGLILGALPLVVIAALKFIKPDYLEPFFSESAGERLFGVAIGLMVICFIVVRKMINVEI